jgi:hypothetical protein
VKALISTRMVSAATQVMLGRICNLQISCKIGTLNFEVKRKLNKVVAVLEESEPWVSLVTGFTHILLDNRQTYVLDEWHMKSDRANLLSPRLSSDQAINHRARLVYAYVPWLQNDSRIQRRSLIPFP